MAECQFCSTFWEIPNTPTRRINVGTTQNPVIHRVCPNVKHDVGPEEEGCKNFTTTKIFWCEVLNCFMYSQACIQRQIKRKTEECSSCYQGENLKSSFRGRRQPPKPENNGRLIV